MKQTTEEKILSIVRASRNGITGKNLAFRMGVKIASLYPYLKQLQEDGDIIKQGNTSNALWHSA